MSVPGIPGLPGMQGTRRSPASDEPEDLELWEQLRLAGAPEAEWRRAQTYEGLYGPEGISLLSNNLDVEDPSQPEGFVGNLYDFLTRGQSAVTGFASGLAGLERRRETRTETGEVDGSLTPGTRTFNGRPLDLDVALDRFMEGISGREKYQAADFGALAYDRETAGVVERGAKSLVGFVFDTALDPLTYLGGAGVYGRVVGSGLVRSSVKKTAAVAVSALDDVTKRAILEDSVVRLGIDDKILTAAARRVEDAARRQASEAGEEIAQRVIPSRGLADTQTSLDVIMTNRSALDRLTSDAVASTAGLHYRFGGSGATYSYLRSTLGDAGIDLYRALPGDLQGGLRFRIPLSGIYNRATTGGAVVTPNVIRLPGTGTGALGRMEVFPGVSGSNISNWARSQLRTNSLYRGVSGRLSGAVGKTGQDVAEGGYRRHRQILDGIYGDVYGKRPDRALDPLERAVSFEEWATLDESLRLFRVGAMGAMREVIGDIAAANQADRLGTALGDTYQAAFAEAIKRNIVSDDGNVFGRTIDDVFELGGREATDAEIYAYEAAAHYQMVLQKMKHKLLNLNDTDAGFTVNMLEDYWPRIADDIEDAFRSNGIRTSNLRERGQFIAEMDETGQVLRWMTPFEIAEQTGESVFVQNPQKLMATYINSIGRVIEEETLFQHLIDRGVLVRGGAESFQEIKNISEASRLWVTTLNRMNVAQSKIRAMGGDTPLRTSGLSPTERAAEVLQAERLANVMAMAGARIHRRKLYEVYEEVPGRGIWSSIDGTQIEAVTENGFTSYVVSRETRGGVRLLNQKNRFGPSEEGTAFGSFDEARRAADIARSGDRDRAYIRHVERLRETLERDIASAIKTQDDLTAAGMNPLSPGNIPATNQDEYFQAITSVIEKYGDATNMISRQVNARAYRDAAYGGGAGTSLKPVGMGNANSPAMRQYWKGRMDSLNVFAAESIVDDVRRIYEAPREFRPFYDGFWVPFYSTQRALMTSLRGPGYVARNIAGGLWNAYLIGTKAKNWADVATIKKAEYAARAKALADAPGDLVAQGQIAEAEFLRFLKSEAGEQRGAELAEIWRMFDARGLGGRTVGSRTRGILAVPGPGGITGNVNLQTSDLDEVGLQRFARVVTQENPWARVMSRMTSESEDFLRLGSFLRGIDEFGMEDGGRAAGSLVHATQFDYSDLSAFEANVIRNIMPFYTWSRHNIPLQIRAMISDPSKVAKALRLNSAFADIFGEPEDPEEPMPQYARDRFSWRVREDLITGPSGDAMAMGLIVGEPLADLNRLFRFSRDPVNVNEVINQLNPNITAVGDYLRATEASTGGVRSEYEEAPPWARAFARRTPYGEKVVSTKGLDFARDIIIPIGMLERYAPQLLGNDRMQRRWYSQIASAVFGLPAATLDPYQTGGELRAQEKRVRDELKNKYGPEYNQYVGFVRRMMTLGADDVEMRYILNVVLGEDEYANVPIEKLDQYRAIDTIAHIRQMEQYRQMGIDESTIAILDANFRPRTDMEMGVRAGKTPAMTAEDLAAIGLKPDDIAKMSDEQRLEVLRKWLDKQQ